MTVTTGFSHEPAHLFNIAAANARAEFQEREPLVFDGYDLAVMATVAVCGIAELTRRFEADIEPFIQRIHGIGRTVERPTLRVVA